MEGKEEVGRAHICERGCLSLLGLQPSMREDRGWGRVVNTGLAVFQLHLHAMQARHLFLETSALWHT